MAWAMAKACLSANTAQPFQNGDNTMKKSAKVTQPAAVKSSNNSSQSTTPTVIPAPHKQQTAKEAIAANVQLLIEQLEQGHSEGLTAYLTAMGRFHRYSFGNILEIARQKSDATRVAGIYAWNQLGRRVKKGEKGIRILAPVIGIRCKKDAEADQDIRTQNQPMLVDSDRHGCGTSPPPRAASFPNSPAK